MKKLIAAVLSFTLFGLMALPAAAQGRDRDYSNRNHSQRSDQYRAGSNYDNRQRQIDRSRQRAYYTYDQGRNNYNYDNRSFWDQHRDKLTTAIGAVGGAILGGAVGGGRGAAIGTVAGAAGSALYTYKIRNRYHRY